MYIYGKYFLNSVIKKKLINDFQYDVYYIFEIFIIIIK